ncbi:hypothetical protein Daus18300_012612 [Diaporthe australafricana]|uniref:Uncharacterized protein n=1 Tax=Diaporthe australafricana TaxID=127596 RepID=A0ABR3W240_9PEZI
MVSYAFKAPSTRKLFFQSLDSNALGDDTFLDYDFVGTVERTGDEASTVPLAACASLLILFSKDRLNIPQKSGDTVLGWDGRSSVELYAIQIARYYDVNVVTTVPTPRSRQLPWSTDAFDYRDAGIMESIGAATKSNLTHVFDTIGNDSSSVTAS